MNAPHPGTNLTGEYPLEYPSAAFPGKSLLKELKKKNLSVMDIPQRMCVCVSLSVCILVVSFIKGAIMKLTV